MSINLNFVLSLFALSVFALPVKAVTVEVSTFRNPNGQVIVNAYKQAQGFPENSPVIASITLTSISATTMRAKLDLPPGRYAFSILHDENSNGEMDTGLFGIPSEGFGFSNNPHITTSAPTFDECAVSVKTNQEKLAIHLIYM